MCVESRNNTHPSERVHSTVSADVSVWCCPSWAHSIQLCNYSLVLKSTSIDAHLVCWWAPQGLTVWALTLSDFTRSDTCGKATVICRASFFQVITSRRDVDLNVKCWNDHIHNSWNKIMKASASVMFLHSFIYSGVFLQFPTCHAPL